METEEEALNAEILKYTAQIKELHPEVYEMLDEDTITVPDTLSPEVKIRHLKDYLESLKVILRRYEKTH
jgi:hypothetical protein